MTNRFQVIIAGGRDFNDYALLERKCDRLFRNRRPTAIISGLARGADSLGARYARERGIDVMEFPADWGRFGKRAGIIRNQSMLQEADALVAFWDGISRGTGNMIGIARKAGIPVRIIRYSK